jgi:hypothetical protein
LGADQRLMIKDLQDQWILSGNRLIGDCACRSAEPNDILAGEVSEIGLCPYRKLNEADRRPRIG